MNVSKTKTINNKYATKKSINMSEVSLEHIDNYVYLGQLMTTDDIMRYNDRRNK